MVESKRNQEAGMAEKKNPEETEAP